MLSVKTHLQLPDWVNASQSSAIEASLKSQIKPGCISYALGLPDMGLFPLELCKEVINDMLHKQHALQYMSPTEELKAHVVRLMQLRGVSCNEREILLTSGAQQGISLLVRLLMNYGDEVLLEELTYPGILQAIAPFSPKILTVNTCFRTGIDVDAVSSVLKRGHRPRFIYVVADGGNPHGASMSQTGRACLAELASSYGIPIIEDDPYGFINYDDMLPPIKQHCSEWVFYTGSFSKIFAPSFRVGWLVVPEWLLPKLASLKESTDINTMTFSQHIVNAILNRNIFTTHRQTIRDVYVRKRDCLIQALEQAKFAGTQFHKPTNGIFLWVNFPKQINTIKLQEIAWQHANVAFIPSRAFCSTDQVSIENGVRLNFSHLSESQLREGIVRLKNVFEMLEI